MQRARLCSLAVRGGAAVPAIARLRPRVRRVSLLLAAADAARAAQATAAMVQLELPHINVLTKVDLLNEPSKAALEQFLVPEARALLGGLDRGTGPAFRRLNAAVAGLVDEWSLVSFAPLDYSDEESVGDVLAQVDHAIQFGEDADVKIRDLGMGELGGEDV